VLDVRPEDTFQVATVEDQQPVETLRGHGAHAPFGDRMSRETVLREGSGLVAWLGETGARRTARPHSEQPSETIFPASGYRKTVDANPVGMPTLRAPSPSSVRVVLNNLSAKE
jgi:hypothetical protein